MPIDPKQFLQTYIEEGIEIIQGMEQAILAIGADASNEEAINTIFRGFHSLKSSSALFGLTIISEFCHTAEDYLQLVRSKEIKLSKDDIELLLDSVDCINKMILDIKKGETSDLAESQQLHELFIKKLALSSDRDKRTIVEAHDQKGWKINFSPDENIFQLGIELSQLFIALSEIGKVTNDANINNLPTIVDIDPSVCYLTWNINIEGDINLNEIEDIFSWVTDSKNIKITPLSKVSEQQEAKKSVADKNISTKMKDSQPDTVFVSDTIRVDTKKIDNLINQIGELIITQSILNQITNNFTPDRLGHLRDSMEHLEFDSRNILDAILSIRMLPITFSFQKIPRLVHDMSQKMNKKVELIIKGEQTEIDKDMMEKIFNPIIHLVRNAIHHGIEPPSARQVSGKNPLGTITLSARQENGMIIIIVEDDGAGINFNQVRDKAIKLGIIKESETISEAEIYKILFQPGFSMAETITDISGRGVGLDEVYKTVKKLGGNIEIESVLNKGTKIVIKLPITLSIMDCQLVRTGKHIYTIPLMSIMEIIKINKMDIVNFDEHIKMYNLRNNFITIINIDKIFNLKSKHADLENKHMIITEFNHDLYGLVVDEILSQQQIVIKNLEENYQRIHGISGATILGDGNVSLIIDTNEVVDMYLHPSEPLISSNIYASKNSHTLNDQLVTEEATDQFQFLTFFIDNKTFGIDLLEVREIIKIHNTTPLPNAPHHIKGLYNLRGVIIPIIDLYDYLDIKRINDKNKYKTVIIITTHDGVQKHTIGMIVDDVSETYTIPFNTIQAKPETISSKLSDNTRGLIVINDNIITLLNSNKMMCSYDQRG
jgi:two-component system, chemotaxis family, sensor kinase CheA